MNGCDERSEVQKELHCCVRLFCVGESDDAAASEASRGTTIVVFVAIVVAIVVEIVVCTSLFVAAVYRIVVFVCPFSPVSQRLEGHVVDDDSWFLCLHAHSHEPGCQVHGGTEYDVLTTSCAAQYAAEACTSSHSGVNFPESCERFQGKAHRTVRVVDVGERRWSERCNQNRALVVRAKLTQEAGVLVKYFESWVERSRAKRSEAERCDNREGGVLVDEVEE